MWTNAKFDSKCAECKDHIQEGDRIVYENRKAYCKECGVEVAGDDPLAIQAPEVECLSAKDNTMSAVARRAQQALKRR